MAVERVTERNDGDVRERIVERDEPVYMERSGASIAGVIIGLAALALVAIIAFFLLSRPTGEESPASVAAPAASVADSAATTARNIGGSASDAARRAGGAPEAPEGQ